MLNSLESLPKLYRLPSSARQFFWQAAPAIASVAGGVLGAAGSLFGGRTPNIDSGQRQQAALQAAQRKEDAYQESARYLEPWREGGKSALNVYGGLTGLPGYTALDRTDWLEETPGYQFLTDQGIKGLSRYGSATGLMASGPAMKGALQFSQGLAQSQAWRPAVEDVWRMSEAGRGASTQTGNWAMDTGRLVGQDYMAAAQAEAEEQARAANARAAQEQNQMGGLFGGLGLGLSGLGQLGGVVNKAGGWGNIFGGGSSPGSAAVGPYGSYLSGGVHGGGANYNLSYPMGYGMKAEGGPVASSRPYIVGEEGPEVFVPQRSGFIIPNHLLRYSAFDNYLKAA